MFQVEGDTLKCCFGGRGKPTPQGLNTFPGAEAVLSILQREGSTLVVPLVSAARVAEMW